MYSIDGFPTQPQVFSQSLLWDWQRLYFTQRGIEAWRQGEVPHYVTSNPMIARSYAELVFAFISDYIRLGPKSNDDKDPNEPLYLCELGAGSGRFAFHFLTQLIHIWKHAPAALPSFCYVLTDVAQSNLDFWRQHPRFQPFFANGMLDLALFDIMESEQLTLQLSGKTITMASLHQPLVVIANYVFDSIPQDLYYIHNQQCFQCLVSLSIDEDPLTLPEEDMLAHLHVHYNYQTLAEVSHQEDALQRLLQDYQQIMNETHLLFPTAGLRCVQRLHTLSQSGLLLLSADKGEYLLSALDGVAVPELVHHGSFSLPVNYHAFKRICEDTGGLSLLPDHPPLNITVSGFLLVDAALEYRETQRAYQQRVRDFGPDDFYVVSRHARQHMAQMTVREILAYIRLSYYDAHLFIHYLPRLLELVSTCYQDERQAVIDVIEHVWEHYFPLGEEEDLALQCATLCYAVSNYTGALTYFTRSMEIYGTRCETLCNMALCYGLLGLHAQARQVLEAAVQLDPNHQVAKAALTAYLTEELNGFDVD